MLPEVSGTLYFPEVNGFMYDIPYLSEKAHSVEAD